MFLDFWVLPRWLVGHRAGARPELPLQSEKKKEGGRVLERGERKERLEREGVERLGKWEGRRYLYPLPNPVHA